jgi:Pectate lyase superfamily protein
MKTLLFISLFIPCLLFGQQPEYNVESYPFNARGDGVTDSRAAIQRAIDTARVHYGTVVFRSGGSYIISGADTVRSNVTIDGKGATIHMTALRTYPSAFYMFGDSNIAIRNVNFVGSDTSTRSWNYDGGIISIHCNGVTVENCAFIKLSGTACGISGRVGMSSVEFAQNIKIDKCTVSYCRSDGISGQYDEKIRITNNYVEHSGSNDGGVGGNYPILFEDPQNIIISNNVCRNNRSGILIDNAAWGSSIVTNNVVDSSASYGCYLYAAWGIVVTGNIFQNTLDAGLLVWSSATPNINATANTFDVISNNITKNTAFSGLSIWDNNAIISNNQIANANNDTSFTHHDPRLWLQAGISILGSHNVVSNNNIYNITNGEEGQSVGLAHYGIYVDTSGQYNKLITNHFSGAHAGTAGYPLYADSGKHTQIIDFDINTGVLGLDSTVFRNGITINGRIVAVTANFSKLANGFIPCNNTDSLGFTNSAIQSNATKTGIGTNDFGNYQLNIGQSTGFQGIRIRGAGGGGASAGGACLITNGVSTLSMGSIDPIVGGATGLDESYIGASGSNLRIGLGDANSIKFVTGGWSNERLTIGSTGAFDFHSGNVSNMGTVGCSTITTPNVILTTTGTAATGMLKYDSGHFYGYNGSAWIKLENFTFGTPTASGIWISTSSGGSPTTQLGYSSVTDALGTTYKVLLAP